MTELLTEHFGGIAATNDWAAIMPEFLLGVLALWLLVLETLLPAKNHALIPRVAVWGQVVILSILGIQTLQYGVEIPGSFFGGMIEQDGNSQIMRLFFLASSIFVSCLGGAYFQLRSLARTEFYHLVLVVAAALMLLVQSSHFVMLFVALETVTICFYVLVAYCRTSVFSLEAGLKYLILGALSSSILLFGIVLLYGAAGNPELQGSTGNGLGFAELKQFILLNSDNVVVRIGVALVLGGLGFKIGAVPFQIWVPDVYQGAPTPVTAYLAVASKAAGFIVLLNLLTGPFAAMTGFLFPLISVIAGATILFGNIGAASQRNVKRMMGLSGVAHAGYLLVGVIAAWLLPSDHWAGRAVVFYLITYLLGSFAVFYVMSFVSGPDDERQAISDYSRLSKQRPFLAMVLALGLGSLAGIPPLAGFIGKLLIFIAAYEARLFGLLALAIVGVVISIYYYFGWIREAFFEPRAEPTGAEEEKALPVLGDKILLGLLAVAVVVVGLFPAVVPVVSQ